MGNIEIRPCELVECHAVLELWLAHHPPGIPEQLDQIQKLVEQFGDYLLVATIDQAIVGAVIAGWDGWRGHLHHLTVRPEYRRRGVARQLVAEAERRLALKGARRISVLVERDNAEANAFYDSLHNVGYVLDTWMQRHTKRLP
jgi:ribosomal protein S18 acetylase RimI-like enzyme